MRRQQSLTFCGKPDVNKAKLKRSLCLLNVAVFIGAATYLPRKFVDTYTWTSEVGRAVKHLLFPFPWTEFIAVCAISILTTCAIYYFVDALSEDADPAREPEDS